MPLCYILVSSSISQFHRFGLLAVSHNCLITFSLLLSGSNNTLTVSLIPENFPHLVCSIDYVLVGFFHLIELIHFKDFHLFHLLASLLTECLF